MEVTNYLLTGMTLQVLGNDRKFVAKKRNKDNHCQASPVQARKKNRPYISIQSWLFNTDPYNGLLSLLFQNPPNTL